MTTTIDYERVAAEVEFGQPSARKTGRDPRWPYVPIIIHPGTSTAPNGYQQQVRGLAYATRDDAIAAAEAHIANGRRALAVQLADPRCRALREQYGLQREIVR